MMRADEIAVPAAKLASVVTSLEMTERPPRRAAPARPEWTCQRHATPDLDWYRDLYRRVGTQWLWSWRLSMSAAELAGIIHDPDVEVHALRAAGRDEGLAEFDFREAGACELKLFGVTGALIGTGAGRWLMNHAIEIAWSRGPRRVWVHTCTMDHPGALAFYVRSGFRPFRRHVEIEDDPRLTGILEASAATHIPLIRP